MKEETKEKFRDFWNEWYWERWFNFRYRFLEEKVWYYISRTLWNPQNVVRCPWPRHEYRYCGDRIRESLFKVVVDYVEIGYGGHYPNHKGYAAFKAYKENRFDGHGGELAPRHDLEIADEIYQYIMWIRPSMVNEIDLYYRDNTHSKDEKAKLYNRADEIEKEMKTQDQKYMKLIVEHYESFES